MELLTEINSEGHEDLLFKAGVSRARVNHARKLALAQQQDLSHFF